MKEIKRKVARFLDPEHYGDVEKSKADFDLSVNQRVAKVISEMDPFEPLMKEFHGIFSAEWTRPEEKLNEPGQLSMKMWAYSQHHDPHFRHMTDWIMNTQANETLKRAPVTPDRILYGRAQISAIILFVKEIGRLSSLYEEILEKNKKDNNFDSNLSAE